MKLKFQYTWAFVLFALASIVAFSAFDKPTTHYTDLTTYEDENGNTVARDASGNVVSGSDFFAGTNSQKIYSLDTMTTAGTTTVNVPWNMASAYQYQYFFKLRKIGVTPNVKVVLDERNAANSSLWSAIDSFSMSGTDSTKLHFRLRGANVYGSFHRIRFVKTGNGAVARNMEFVIKSTN